MNQRRTNITFSRQLQNNMGK